MHPTIRFPNGSQITFINQQAFDSWLARETNFLTAEFIPGWWPESSPEPDAA